MFDHFLCDFEIRNHPVAERADGMNITWGPAEHHFRFVPDGEHLFAAFNFGNGHHRWFVQNDPAAFDVNQCIGRAEVDRHIGRNHA